MKCRTTEKWIKLKNVKEKETHNNCELIEYKRQGNFYVGLHSTPKKKFWVA